MVTKLTEEQVMIIYVSTDPIQDLADAFNVHVATVRKIKNRTTWKRVTNLNYIPQVKYGRPHQSDRTRKKAWCPNGCGKSVSGKYHGSLYYYQCERCQTMFENKPKW